MAKKLLLLGWDAADWQIIHPMIEKGLMPALKHLIENGVSGNLATLEPVFSPMLWTSIATGKRADKHGVLGFTEPDYASGGVKPVSTFSRKTAAIWNILSHENLKSNVVGWWPSHPVEPINGCMVSNMFQRAVKPNNEAWPMPKGTVFPKQILNQMKDLRVHYGELTESHILPFVPDAAKIDQEKDKRLFPLTKILAEAASIHNAGTWLMENTEWDFMTMYFDNIDHFSHAFMKYHPPKLKGVKQEDYDLYKNVIEAAYRYHDMMLGRVLNITDGDTTIMLVSDHGFESGSNRMLALPKEAGAPAYDHRSYGIFAAMGPGIKKDELVYGANLLDITPTILAAMNLPIGEDMDGKPLLNIFDEEKELKYVDSWDNYVQRKTDGIEDKATAEESMKMLIELGYVEKPNEKTEIAFEKSKIENDFNLARVYLSSNRPQLAIEILEPLFESDPSMRFGLRLAIAYEAIEAFEQGLLIVEKLESTLKKPVQQLRALKASFWIELELKDKAIELLESMSKKKATAPFVAQRVSEGLIEVGKFKLAKEYLDKTLVYFPDNASLSYLKGDLLLKSKKFNQAVDCFLASIGCQYFHPKAHFKLGSCLEKMGLKEDAYRAYSVSLQQNPKSKMSQQQLAKLEKEGIKIDFNKGERVYLKSTQQNKNLIVSSNQSKYLESLEGTVYVVSGFPRSGTSMMMQMLNAGGMKVFSDHKRKADENNPKGYFEHEGIKSLAKRPKLLLEAKGKLVKL
ncbi:MAG: alkaline phosphatase family protein [Vicingaceae bacterium]